LQRSEIREVEEGFAKGQKGSSAMPHKRNPIGSENMCGMARVIRGYMLTAYENVPLWHERDISHSSAERVILPDATIGLDYMLHRFANILENLTVFPENMRRNMKRTFGLPFSQHVLLALIEKGLSREEAYDIVQPNAMKSWETETPFRAVLDKDTRVTDRLSPAELDACFDETYHLKNVNLIFERLGLND
jgi:adenylosuccinate lyase